MLNRLEFYYEHADISPASDDFWAAVNAIEAQLVKELVVRPIGDFEITRACQKAEKAFRSALATEQAQRVQRS